MESLLELQEAIENKILPVHHSFFTGGKGGTLSHFTPFLKPLKAPYLLTFRKFKKNGWKIIGKSDLPPFHRRFRRSYGLILVSVTLTSRFINKALKGIYLSSTANHNQKL